MINDLLYLDDWFMHAHGDKNSVRNWYSFASHSENVLLSTKKKKNVLLLGCFSCTTEGCEKYVTKRWTFP